MNVEVMERGGNAAYAGDLPSGKRLPSDGEQNSQPLSHLSLDAGREDVELSADDVRRDRDNPVQPQRGGNPQSGAGKIRPGGKQQDIAGLRRGWQHARDEGKDDLTMRPDGVGETNGGPQPSDRKDRRRETAPLRPYNA